MKETFNYKQNCVNQEWYNPNIDLSPDDQWYLWNFILTVLENKTTNTYLNGNLNGGYKRIVNRKLFPGKEKVILQLRNCNCKTPPIETASYLKELFNTPETKEGHWLYIAQNYTARAINRVIVLMNKQFLRGERPIPNPARYFTFLIKRRKPKHGSSHH